MIYSIVPKGIGISPGSVIVGHKQRRALFRGRYLYLVKAIVLQWGSNSKVPEEVIKKAPKRVSVPAMVDVNSTVCYLRIDIWPCIKG